MAITSIWSVKGWLGKVIVYTENPDKTENPGYFEKQGMTQTEAQSLSDVIDYAAQNRKTQLTDESCEILRHYVTGVNCDPDTAREEMLAAKKKFGKEDGVVAYHGIQSFAPEDLQAAGGKLTPDMAHEIGVKLAQRLWGEQYQVVVATHLDKANHLHSHFVLNTVSWVDGIRYHRTKQDYYQMQTESDALCRAYGLSVIAEPQAGRRKQYGEWKAEKEGKSTYRGMVRADIDRAILESMTERQLWENLHRQGWRIQFGKDVTVCPPGKERGLKLYRNFGEDYSIEAIRNRILANSRPQRRLIPAPKQTKRIRFAGKWNTAKRITGLRALYFSYLHKMGAIPKQKSPNPNSIYFLFREDIRHIQNITRETRLLVKHGIDTLEQLREYKTVSQQELRSLCSTRKQLRNKARRTKGPEELAMVKSEIGRLTGKIGGLRREVMYCEDIEKRSVDMRVKLHKAAEEQAKSQGKELKKKHEPFRRRG